MSVDLRTPKRHSRHLLLLFPSNFLHSSSIPLLTPSNIRASTLHLPGRQQSSIPHNSAHRDRSIHPHPFHRPNLKPRTPGRPLSWPQRRRSCWTNSINTIQISTFSPARSSFTCRPKLPLEVFKSSWRERVALDSRDLGTHTM